MKKILITVAFTTLSLQAHAESFSKDQEAAIKTIVQNTLKENPTMIMDTLKLAAQQEQQKQQESQTKSLAASKDQLFGDKVSPFLGNVNGSKVITVFLDPYCGHCRDFHAPMEEAVKAIPAAKIIIKDLPIFPPSELAVSALLAAHKQRKYMEFYRAMTSSQEPLEREQLLTFASKVGIDVSKMAKDMDSPEIKNIINENRKLAAALLIRGTPGIATPTEIIPGGVRLDQLKEILQKLA